MFCPKCRSEFREGFTFCERCGENLVEELPPEEPGVRKPSPVIEGVKKAFLIEVWLKRGAVVYTVVGILSDIAAFFAKTNMPSPFGMARSGPVWVFVYVVDLIASVAGSLLWGAFFYAMGRIIEILKEGFGDERA
jgi:hypothetical protein